MNKESRERLENMSRSFEKELRLDFLYEMQAEEKARKEILTEQIKKGCDQCSQWNEYFGCDKCERI